VVAGQPRSVSFGKTRFILKCDPPTPPPPDTSVSLCVSGAYLLTQFESQFASCMCWPRGGDGFIHALRVGVFPPCKAAKFSPLLGAFALASSAARVHHVLREQDKWTTSALFDAHLAALQAPQLLLMNVRLKGPWGEGLKTGQMQLEL
jgi:hypothetical protein